MVTFMNMTITSLRPSALIFSCLAVFALASLAGCACNEKHSESSEATMDSDSKDMSHRSHHDSH